MIDIQPSQFLQNTSDLDGLSVTEIELLIQENPACQLYHILLAKKMSHSYTHDTALRNEDYVLRTFGWNNLDSFDVFTEHATSSETHIELPALINEKEVMLEALVDKETNMAQLGYEQNLNMKPEDSNFSESVATEENIELEQDKIFESPKDDALNSEKNKEMSDTVKEDFEIAPKREKKKNKKKNNKSTNFKLNQFAGITAYSQWLLSFKRDDVEKKIAKELKAQKKKELADIAKKSVTKSNELVSESLADLLVQQGHFDDAKKMYGQLMHRIPEKSRYFAAKIENLLK